MQAKSIEKYFFISLLSATFIFTFFIFRPFWIILILGISFAIVLYPIYAWFKKEKLPNWLASFVTVAIFITIVCGPLLGISAMIFNQSKDVYQGVVNDGSLKPFIESTNQNINNILPEGVNFDLNTKMIEFVSYTENNIANIFSTAISAFFSFILIIIIMFYCLKENELLKKNLMITSPLGQGQEEKIVSKLAFSIDNIVKGFFLIAIFQGIFISVGLFIVHIHNVALWGVVAGVASLVPPIGAAFVSIPAIVFLFITGHTNYDIFLIIWAIIIHAFLDNIIRPVLLSRKINIPPILIFFSMLGGLSFLGPVGILIGPLAVSLLDTLTSIYREDFNKTN